MTSSSAETSRTGENTGRNPPSYNSLNCFVVNHQSLGNANKPYRGPGLPRVWQSDFPSFTLPCLMVLTAWMTCPLSRFQIRIYFHAKVIGFEGLIFSVLTVYYSSHSHITFHQSKTPSLLKQSAALPSYTECSEALSSHDSFQKLLFASLKSIFCWSHNFFLI